MCKTIYLRYKMSPKNLWRATKYCKMQNPLYAMSHSDDCKFGHLIKQQTRTCDQRDLHVCLNITCNHTIPCGASIKTSPVWIEKWIAFLTVFISREKREEEKCIQIYFLSEKVVIKKREKKRESWSHIYIFLQPNSIFATTQILRCHLL